MNASNEKLLQQAEAAIEDDKLILPSPPDAMVKIMAVLDDVDASPRKIAMELNRDPALTARIIKVANSASYQQQNILTDLGQVIPRLGLKLIKTLVTSHMMMQMFAPPDAAHKQRLGQLNLHSLKVARYAYAIARLSRTVPAEDALLAGLMHDIGYLPLLQINTNMNEKTFDAFLFNYHPKVGAQLLKKWHVPDAIVLAVAEHENWKRTVNGKADLADVVLIANLICTEENHPAFVESSSISAYERLGIARDSDLSELSEYLSTADSLLPQTSS